MTEQQKHLFTNRWRKVRTLDPLEVQIQISLIARLKLLVRPDVIYFHIPNGEERDKRVAAKLKAMGVLPGVADLLFIWSEQTLRALFLELKRRGNALEENQEQFKLNCEAIGVLYAWADNIDDAVKILQGHNLLKQHT